MEAQKIIITGGATRIGAAIAERLSGFKVQILIQYNKSKSKAENLRNNLEQKGSKIYLIKADLGKEKDVLKIVKFAKKNMGYLDCLINNASAFENDKIENFNSRSWNNHLNANLKAPAILSKEFSKCVVKGNNNIINIIDQRVFKLTPYFFSYTLSKAGLYTMTKTSSMSLSPKIRVNGIAPGQQRPGIRAVASYPLRGRRTCCFWCENGAIAGSRSYSIFGTESGKPKQCPGPNTQSFKE